jgi:peptidyl-prolyl cis-trans isomerase D
MFDFIRNHNKAIQLGMMVFVLPGFFLFGIEGFNSMGEKSETVAVVAGKKIGKIQWDAAVKEDAERLRQNAPSIDPKLSDSADFKYASLEQLVKRQVLATAAQKLHLGVSDQKVAAELLQNPAFAALRKPDGKIDESKYRQLLAPQGLTPQDFEARVRSDLSVQQVQQSLTKSGMVPAALADAALNAYFEKREIQILSFTAADFAKKITPTDAEIEAFYKSNAPLFQATEKASIQYVVLDLESMKRNISVNEADIKKYYDENGDKQSIAEERKASHILISAGKTATADERQKAKKQAEDLLIQIKKSPANFSDIAKKNSQDPVSAANGGDLGFFGRGSMVKPFEDAIFAMQPKQISDIVETDFGYHIIQLVEVKVPKKRSFADMRTEIEAELKKQMAQKKFAESAEIFTNTVYEQSDSLKPVADKLKLEIQTAEGISRQAPQGVRGALANNKFLSVLFSSDSLEKKRNTESVELGGNQLVAGRVVTYTPAQTQPFAEVKARAQTLLAQRMALDLARKEGAAKWAELVASPDTTPAQLAAPITVSRDVLQQQNLKLVEAVLRASNAKLPLWLGIDLGAEGYRVVRLNKLIEGAQSAAALNRDQYLQVWSNAENTSYYEYLKDKFKVQIKAPKPDKKTDSKSKST